MNFLPRDLAILAKQKRFNEPCIAFYAKNVEGHLYVQNLITSNLTTVTNYQSLDDLVATAPTFEDIFEWLSYRGFSINYCKIAGQDAFKGQAVHNELVIDEPVTESSYKGLMISLIRILLNNA